MISSSRTIRGSSTCGLKLQQPTRHIARTGSHIAGRSVGSSRTGSGLRSPNLHANNLRMKTRGQTDDDVRRMVEAQFPLKGVYKEFTFCNCYKVLMDSEKFRADVDARWPKKQRLDLAGDYSSSGGSHDLPDDAQDFPSPPSFTRRTRPVGQRTEQRARSRGVAQGQEVQSTSPLLASQQPSSPNSRVVNKRG